jgi:hypothetical protein
MRVMLPSETQLRAVTDTIRDIVDMRSELDAVRESRDRFELELRELRRERPDLPDGFAYMAPTPYPGAEPQLMEVVRRAIKEVADSIYSDKGLDVVISRLLGRLEDTKASRASAVGRSNLLDKQLEEANVALAKSVVEETRLKALWQSANESNTTLSSALANEQGLVAQLRLQLADRKTRRKR